MGRGGKRVSNCSGAFTFSANCPREVAAAVEVEEVEAMVGVEGDNEIIGTIVPVTTSWTRRMRSWRDFTTAS
jgi:hypothetical protein